ncbi:hypothetical protein BX666DRAFT_315279 [Dichotomocladium elegans]|nr:hypothetical protein BX666DRAFT_315279 [Dichotomocladium elegans]
MIQWTIHNLHNQKSISSTSAHMFTIKRFSGSTLEPSTEPIILYPEYVYQRDPRSHLTVPIIPTRCTPPLKRLNKPMSIRIPSYNHDLFASPGDSHNGFSAWSYEKNPGLMNTSISHSQGSTAPVSSSSSSASTMSL